MTNDGQPLLIYTQNGLSPMICRAVNIIDARVVMPGLKDEMDRAGWSPPIVFNNQTDLSRAEQLNVEKEWAPFLGDDDDVRPLACLLRSRHLICARSYGSMSRSHLSWPTDTSPTRPSKRSTRTRPRPTA